MPTTRLSILLVAAAIATMPGCGGDDENTPKNADTSTTSTAPATLAHRETTTAETTTSTPKGKNDPAPGIVVQAYFNALSKRDVVTACGFMNATMQRAAVRFATATMKKRGIEACADALREIIKPAGPAELKKIRDVDIISSTVKGASGTVKVKSASRDALLEKTGGRWLISGGIFTG